MLIGKSAVVGIDIGSNSIKVVELEELGTAYRLKNIGEAPIARGSIVGKAVEKSELISNVLSTLIDDIDVEADDAAVSISGDPVLLKRVSLPAMSDAELKKSIKWEIGQISSEGIQDFNYDYQIINSNNSNDRIDVLVAAVNKNIAKEYLSIISRVGLNPVLIDLDVFSLGMLYELNYPDTEGLLALVNIGASVTNVLIIQNGDIVFAKDLAVGGNQYSDLIMTKMNILYEQAEEVKYDQRAGFSNTEIQNLADCFVKLISAEIKETLDYFSVAYGAEKVKRVMISGGTSHLEGLRESLSELTQAYVGILNPFRNIEFNEEVFDPEYIKDISPQMCVAAGLALNKV